MGRTGTYETAFTIPNLNHEHTQLPISSVVLAGQRQSLKLNEALYSVKTADKESIRHPLIEGKPKLLLNVAHVFGSSRQICGYLEAYERYADTMQPLFAVATFHRHGKKAYQPQPIAVMTGIDRISHAIPIRLALPTLGLSPGIYDLNITGIAPTAGKTAFWQTPVAIQR